MFFLPLKGSLRLALFTLLTQKKMSESVDEAWLNVLRLFGCIEWIGIIEEKGRVYVCIKENCEK